MRSWKVLKWKKRPKHTHLIEFTCLDCEKDAHLPVSGLVLAQLDWGLVFDSTHSMPDEIECPNCRRRKELE